jgi:hypothetical protein
MRGQQQAARTRLVLLHRVAEDPHLAAVEGAQRRGELEAARADGEREEVAELEGGHAGRKRRERARLASRGKGGCEREQDQREEPRER